MRSGLGWRNGSAGCVVALVVGVLLALLVLPGCGTTAEERVGWYERQMSAARAVIDEVDERVEPAMEQLVLLEERLAAVEAETPGSEVAADLERAVREAKDVITAAYERKGKALAVIETAEREVQRLKEAGGGIGDELVAIGNIGQAVAPATGPGAFWVGLVSALVSGIGSLMVGKTALKRPGDITPEEAKRREEAAWDEADAKAFERGVLAGMGDRGVER
ncbi:MAG: hypothetical protein AAGE65_14740 [Planctomycetota bacterium]